MNFPFLQAKDYHQGRRGYNGDGKIHGVVIHTMEAPEKGTTAESTANFFRNGPPSPASADWCIDNNSAIECVRATDEAYHAPPASRWTRGYEHAGYARQVAADWHDPYSWAMLQLSSTILAAEAAEFGIPLVYLDSAALLAGHIDGVTTHNEVSQAWHQSTHWDPGPAFPMDQYLQMAANGLHTVPPPAFAGVIKEGDTGGAVKFLQEMLNLLIKFRVAAKGAPAPIVLQIDQAHPGFGPKTKEAVIEFQRFLVFMWTRAGQHGPRPNINGIVDAQTAAGISYWVPIALKQPK